MKFSEKDAHKPVISLCIPTDGTIKWVIPVIRSIYSQEVDNDLFEVIITDNGEESNLGKAIQTFNYPNLKYYKSDYSGFTNQIFALKQGNGIFRKMLNHRSCILSGKLQAMINIINHYKDSRPIIYFSDNRLESNKTIIECDNYDEFVSNLHYWISWSAGVGVWYDDIPVFEGLNPNSTFPHICMILDIRQDSKCVIWNEVYQDMLPDIGKGGYNFFNAFAVVFLDIMQSYERRNKISQSCYKTIKKQLFTFLTENYFSEVLYPSTIHNYDLSNIRKSITVHYSNRGYLSLITNASFIYLIRGFRKIFKLLHIKLSLH